VILATRRGREETVMGTPCQRWAMPRWRDRVDGRSTLTSGASGPRHVTHPTIPVKASFGLAPTVRKREAMKPATERMRVLAERLRAELEQAD